MEDKIQKLLEAKCHIPDCGEKQFVFAEIMGMVVPFCEKHFKMFMDKTPEMNRTAKKVAEILSKSRGEYVRINSWKEFKEKLKPELLEASTQGLEFTKGKCLDCGKPAIGIVTFMKPVCEKHMGFPRMVDKVALKEEKLSYIG